MCCALACRTAALHMPMIDSKNSTVKQAKCMGLHGFFEKDSRLNRSLMCESGRFQGFFERFK